MNEKHVGSDFDDFLREEGLLEKVETVAAERVLEIVEDELTSTIAFLNPPSKTP